MEYKLLSSRNTWEIYLRWNHKRYALQEDKLECYRLSKPILYEVCISQKY